MDEFYAPLTGASAAAPKKKDDGWRCVQPVPDDAPPPLEAHPRLGRPAGRWLYVDRDGRLLGLANRFDTADGGKEFRPLSLWQRDRDHRREWRWESMPPLRPLYGLDCLAERPKAPVVVCEGEKATDAARHLLPGFVGMTSPNGSKSAAKADWSPLAGRRVVIWPDADPAGTAYADAVASMARDAGASSVAVLAPPEGVGEGWDAADAEAEGWTTTEAEAFVASARSAAVVDLETARRAKKASEGAAKKTAAKKDGRTTTPVTAVAADRRSATS